MASGRWGQAMSGEVTSKLAPVLADMMLRAHQGARKGGLNGTGMIGHDGTAFPIDRVALIAAYEAALAVASEMRLEPVLQRLVDLARRVVPARYAALGVVGDNDGISQMVVSGISPEARERIGPMPKGHGLLGVLIRDRTPLLVADIATDPRSAGFPPGHPPMRSLVGVPIVLGDRVLGNLYLADRLDGAPFTMQDVTVLETLAGHAATAIDRAQRYVAVEEGQRHAEEQLAQLQVILDNLPAGVLVVAPPDAAVQMLNTTARETIFGPGAGLGALPTPGSHYRWQGSDGTALRRGQHPGIRALGGEVVENQQLGLVCADERVVPMLVQAAPLRDSDDRVVGAVVVFQDVSRLRAAEQIKDDFLSLISHEFRTPLTAIRGGAHLLSQQGDVLDEETRRDLLQDIVVESNRLDRMLANLLKVSEIMAGRFRATSEPVLLGPLVQEVIGDYRRRAPAYHLALETGPDVPPAEGDPELLRQVLRNLYENAVKYSSPGSTIHTTVRSGGGRVAIDVRDEGVGIAPEHVAHVFERFRRPGADPTVRGMGLGLYLSQLLVEAQAGQIHAASAGRGTGATFTVELPVAPEWREMVEGRAEGSEEERCAEAPDSGG